MKCPTINSRDKVDLLRLGVKKELANPLYTISSILGGGTQFREPIIIKDQARYIERWQQPIIVAHHVSACDGCATDMTVPPETKIEVMLTPMGKDRAAPVQKPSKIFIDNFKGSGVFLG